MSSKFSDALVIAMSAMFLMAAPTMAQEQEREQEQEMEHEQEREQVYGSQLMSKQERLEYSKKMREAATEQERETIRAEHHKQMSERATKQGVKLPDAPPTTPGGGGMGGGGMGGGGMGGGGGRR